MALKMKAVVEEAMVGVTRVHGLPGEVFMAQSVSTGEAMNGIRESLTAIKKKLVVLEVTGVGTGHAVKRRSIGSIFMAMKWI